MADYYPHNQQERHTMKFDSLRTLIAVLALLTCGFATAQEQTPQERVFQIKSILVASKQALMQYQWIETQTLSLNGEQKSQTVNRCYYGPDGTVQKMQLSTTPPAPKKPGIRGEIQAKEEAELKTYLQNAVTLAHSYAPPDPALLQAAFGSGNLAVVPQPNQGVRLTFSNYLKAGDSLAIDVDLSDNRLQDANVASYMDTPDQAVTLAVTWGILPNGISYVSNVVLNAPAKKLAVTVQNSDYVAVAPQ
jgi:hypothetical protein